MIKVLYSLGTSLSSKNNKQLQAWQACFPFNLVLMSTLPDFSKFGETSCSKATSQNQTSHIWELWTHCSRRRVSVGWWLLRVKVPTQANEFWFRTSHFYNQWWNWTCKNNLFLRLPSVKGNWRKQRTAYHAVNDFNLLSQEIWESANINTFKRHFFNFFM